MSNMKIKRWIRDGYIDSNCCPDTDSLLRCAEQHMDSNSPHEIMGELLFEGEDGKYYVGQVVFSIDEANPDYVKDVLEEEDA